MGISQTTLLCLILVAFIAGFIDSIAGGGGMLVLPSLLFSGIPPQLALGTSKFASLWGTAVASMNFIRKRLVWWPMVLAGLGFSWVGSLLGSQVILGVSEQTAGKIIIGLFPLAMIGLLYKRPITHHEHPTSIRSILPKLIGICFLVGFYDGFFGPGTGAFLAIGFYSILHLSLTRATAHAKIFNFLSNLSAMGVFILNGKILYAVAIPIAIASMAGNYLGSQMAIKKGDRLIRVCLALVLALLMANVGWRVFAHSTAP